MPVNKLIFEDAEKARDAITASQKKEIAKLYKNWAAEIGERAKYYSHKSAPSYAVAERQMKELMKQMEATSHEVANEIYTGVKKSIYLVSDSVVQQNAEWLKSLGFEGGTIDAAFNYIPDEVVRNLITGQIYDSGWSLSKRIWSDNEETMKQAYQIVAGGIAQNKSVYEIAKDLKSYVEPGAKKPWNLTMKDGRKIYPKQVDYNAQRLARTLVQHGYQQSFVATTQKNPFITDYIWRSNGSRVCELCISRDGQHFSKDDLPMDHPNGMCTIEPVVADDMVDQLADWFNSPDGTYPEIDEFASNFGHNVKEKFKMPETKVLNARGTKNNSLYEGKRQANKAESIQEIMKEIPGIDEKLAAKYNTAIKKYTSEDYGNIMNAFLEGDEKSALGKNAKFLQEYLTKSPTWDNSSPIYRGVSVSTNELDTILKNYKVGETFDTKVFGSYSDNFKTALSFSKPQTKKIVSEFGTKTPKPTGKTGIVFKVNNTNNAVPVAKYSSNIMESEIIMPANVKFTVESVTTKTVEVNSLGNTHINEYIEILLKEVPK